MPSPTEEIYKEIVRDFNFCWNFPNCIESVDAKYIRIHCLLNACSQYFNYKQCHSIVLQAVVDTNHHFLTVDIGAYSKQDDGGVFQYSALYQNLETQSLKFSEDTVLPHSQIMLPHTFVGDEAYPLTTYLMKLYSRRTLDRSKAIFNYRLSHVRVVESAFRIYASKWRILDKAIET
jgi:hypothetical protein